MGSSDASSLGFGGRMGGAFYILMGLCGGLATLARRGLIVPGDATTTSANILAHQSMYLMGFAGDLLVVASYVVVVALFYRMLEPVNRTVALIAAYFGLMGCAVQALALIFYLAPLSILGGAPYLDVFKLGERQALAFTFLKLYSPAYGIAIALFGFYCLLTGYLAFTSTFLPRVAGALMMLAGVSWLTFLSPLVAAKYLPYVATGAVGEGLFALWLLVKGVNAERWSQRAEATRLAESV